MTTTVLCQTSDSVIWNKEKFIIDLTMAATKGNVIINFNTEGPCCESIGLNAIIDHLVEKHGFDLTQFSIIQTGNQLPSIDVPTQKIHDGGLFIKKFANRPVQFTESSLEKRFAILIGRSNWIRLGLASYLWNYHRAQSAITFHYNNDIDFHRANFGLEEFVQRYYQHKQQAVNFLEQGPMTYEHIDSYPFILGQGEMIHALAPLYKTVFCEIVCETYFSGKTFHLTEKTLRPMLYKRPFIVQGPRHFVKNLKLLGFKTFDSWWDEGYDQDHHDSRYETITNNIEWIAGQTDTTITRWYNEMQSILEHNYQTAMSLTDNKVTDTDFYYE